MAIKMSSKDLFFIEICAVCTYFTLCLFQNGSKLLNAIVYSLGQDWCGNWSMHVHMACSLLIDICKIFLPKIGKTDLFNFLHVNFTTICIVTKTDELVVKI